MDCLTGIDALCCWLSTDRVEKDMAATLLY